MRTIIFLFLVSIITQGHAQCTRVSQFQDADYEVDGTVTVAFLLDGTKLAKIGSDFLTVNGPDLYVYLAHTPTINTASGIPSGTVELGLLQSITGASEYSIPSNVEINDYSYVVIQCKQFSITWGSAQLGAFQGPDCATLSIEDNSFETISFFPNPTKHKITFNVALEDYLAVTIYNYSGLKMLQKDIYRSSKEILLDKLSPGMYLVALVLNGKRSTKKLIVN